MTSLVNGVLNFFLAIILPVQLYLLLIGGVILLDTYFGVLKSNKLSIPFNFHQMLKGITKKIAIYTPAMVGIFWLDQHLINEFMMLFINIENAFTKIGCAVLISTELASINESLKAVTGRGFFTRLKDIFKAVRTVKDESKDLLPPKS